MVAYYRPRLLEQALELRADRPLQILAGGTDVYPAKTGRAGWGDMRHPDILDVSGIDTLQGVREEGGFLILGALTTWSDLRRMRLLPAFAGLQAAAGEIGGRQIQNRGTLVGNICTASPAGDGIPCLLTLDAEVELASAAGTRCVPLARFITGYRQTDCRSDEIVTALRIPKPQMRARGTFVKLGARRYLVISIVMAAAVITADEDGIVRSAAIGVGACSPTARRLPDLEQALVGQSLAAAPDLVAPEHIVALAPIDDVRASAAYRRVAAFEVVRDLLASFAPTTSLKAA